MTYLQYLLVDFNASLQNESATIYLHLVSNTLMHYLMIISLICWTKSVISVCISLLYIYFFNVNENPGPKFPTLLFEAH